MPVLTADPAFKRDSCAFPQDSRGGRLPRGCRRQPHPRSRHSRNPEDPRHDLRIRSTPSGSGPEALYRTSTTPRAHSIRQRLHRRHAAHDAPTHAQVPRCPPDRFRKSRRAARENKLAIVRHPLSPCPRKSYVHHEILHRAGVQTPPPTNGASCRACMRTTRGLVPIARHIATIFHSVGGNPALRAQRISRFRKRLASLLLFRWPAQLFWGGGFVFFFFFFFFFFFLFFWTAAIVLPTCLSGFMAVYS